MLKLITLALLFIHYVAQKFRAERLCQISSKWRVLTIWSTCVCVQADEAEATYKTCIADATTQQLELEHTKVTVLRQLQDVIKQSDQTIRSVSAPTQTARPSLRPVCRRR